MWFHYTLKPNTTCARKIIALNFTFKNFFLIIEQQKRRVSFVVAEINVLRSAFCSAVDGWRFNQITFSFKSVLFSLRFVWGRVWAIWITFHIGLLAFVGRKCFIKQQSLSLNVAKLLLYCSYHIFITTDTLSVLLLPLFHFNFLFTFK